MNFTISNSTIPLSVSLTNMGSDLAVCIYGGQTPHVGCVVLASPRPSLTGNGLSATHSVINCLGHKDDEFAVPIALYLAKTLNCTVSCTSGIHIDSIEPTQIEMILNLKQQICEEIIARVQKGICHE